MNEVTATPENVNVGDILYATYNYNRVSHYFYKVIAKRGKATLDIQALKWCFTGGQNEGIEEPGDPEGRIFSVRYGKRGFRTDRYLSNLKIWDGKPMEFRSWD